MHKKLQSNLSLNPMIDAIEKAIITKHPNLVQFIAQVMDTNILPKKPDPIIITNILNHMYLLDLVVDEIMKSPEFLEPIIKQGKFLQQKKAIRQDFLGKFSDLSSNIGFFGSVKAISVDVVVDLMMNKKINRQKPKSPSTELILRETLLALNILEATLTDAKSGMLDNVIVGLKLAFNQKENQAWMSLYQSWNLAFIIANLDNLNILLPKLLIPQVIAADPSDYIYIRTIALALTIDFYILSHLENTTPICLENKIELARILGEINVSEQRTLN